MWPYKSALWLGGEFTVLKNRLPAQNCPDNPASKFSADVWTMAVAIMQRLRRDKIDIVKIDNRQVGVFADLDAAFVSNPETLRDVCAR